MVDEHRRGSPVPPRRPPFTRRQVVSQVAVAAVILVSGIGIGTGGTILSLKDRIRWRPPSRGEFPKPPNQEEIAVYMRREYSFTDEQIEQTNVIFANSFAAMGELWMKFREQEQAQRENILADMKNILTPEQFEKWERDFRERARHMRPGGPGKSGGPGGPGGPGRPGGRGGPGRSGGPGGPDRHRDRGPYEMRGPESRPMVSPNEPPVEPIQ